MVTIRVHFLAGDVYSSWSDLQDSISGFLEFSFYGMPMVGVDICGFNGETNEDLCARWQAVGAFYPFSRNHNDIHSKDQDPAVMGEKVLTATRNTLYWRYKLLPHLYTLFYYAHTTGSTVARPLFFNYPTDTKTYDNDEQFMWGDSLMVVPALHEGQEKIHAYFPKGIWYDLQNKTSTIDASKGGLYNDLDADWDTVHFFMKGGHAVFYQEPANTTTDSRLNPYGVYVFLNEANQALGHLFIDDGESDDSITNDNFSLIEIVATDSNVILATDKGRPQSNILTEVHVYGIQSKPHSVQFNGELLLPFNYDPSKKLLSVYGLNTTMDFAVLSFNKS